MEPKKPWAIKKDLSYRILNSPVTKRRGNPSWRNWPECKTHLSLQIELEEKNAARSIVRVWRSVGVEPTQDAETEAGASGAQTTLADYRPISIFPTFSKYIETLLMSLLKLNCLTNNTVWDVKDLLVTWVCYLLYVVLCFWKNRYFQIKFENLFHFLPQSSVKSNFVDVLINIATEGTFLWTNKCLRFSIQQWHYVSL